MRLENKVCIITGGGSGIGRAMALLFAKEGAHVVVADKRKDAAAKVAGECAAGNRKAMAIEVDVSRGDDVKRMIDETVKAHGRLDVIVNNAGYGTFGTVVDIEEAEWDALMAVNVRGVFLCCKHAINAMKKTGGGTIDTPYYDDVMARAPDKAAFRKGLEGRQPVGRLGTPEEIAAGILFLASDESGFAHGTILTIDGGFTAQ